ncbi:unnamed protein product [Blepharisma stoltei]|uniref:Uncharacterized protein n=1 Tax=Blepharisma stoltei TaxID=1481888 RepID=A0AAU9ID25_9CILI|nr:unnamed protein product [Blepharisma stoltei]
MSTPRRSIRPRTAISQSATLRWKNRSFSPQNSHLAKNSNIRQVRNLLITQNPNDFIDTQTIGRFQCPFTAKSTNTSEASDQLNILKKRFNFFRNSWTKEETQKETLGKELWQLEQQEAIIGSRAESLNSKLKYLEENLTKTKLEQEKSENDQMVNLTILERTKQNLIHLEIKANSLREDLKNKASLLDDEHRKNLTSREKKKRSINVYKKLNNSVEYEIKEKTQIVSAMNRDFKSRQKAIGKREDRKKRHAEISEAAENEEKDLKLNKSREGFLAHRLWARFLIQKFEKSTKNSSQYETAFHKIRAATGLNDINQVIDKFLTSEHSYAELMKSVYNLKTKITETKEKNTKLESDLKSFGIAEKGLKASNKEELENKINGLLKENENLKLRLNEFVMNKTQVLQWGRKMLTKLNSGFGTYNQYEDGPFSQSEHISNLREIFITLREKIIPFILSVKEKSEPGQEIKNKSLHQNVYEAIYEIPDKDKERFMKIKRILTKLTTSNSEIEAGSWDFKETEPADATPKVGQTEILLVGEKSKWRRRSTIKQA